MKTKLFLPAILIVVTAAFAQDSTPTASDTKSADGSGSAPKRKIYTYVVPKSVAGGVRIDGDGGSRGPDLKLPSLYVLAPNHTALTTSEHPSLFWFQAGPAPAKLAKDAKVELTLTDPDPKKTKPLVKVSALLSADKEAGAGIRRIKLAKQKITLEPGLAYKWSVALVPDPANRSQDVIASGTIQRIEPSKELTAELNGAAAADKGAIYASNGVWYDAIEAITDEIDKDSKNTDARAQRAALLSQVGLKDAAAYEKK